MTNCNKEDQHAPDKPIQEGASLLPQQSQKEKTREAVSKLERFVHSQSQTLIHGYICAKEEATGEGADPAALITHVHEAQIVG